jgi:hypothetical protein
MCHTGAVVQAAFARRGLLTGMTWLLTYGIPLYAVLGCLLLVSVTTLLPSTPTHVALGVEHALVESGSKRALKVAPVLPDLASAGNDSRSVSDIAKLAIDASKERIDAMKETYDRLFALIAALGALLAFLGFKGFECFALARAKAETTVEMAEAAIQGAAAARERAEDAIVELNRFLTQDYPRNTTAEINVAHGLIMREIAEVYEAVAGRMSLHGKSDTFPERRQCLRDSLAYLDRALASVSSLDTKVRCRALGTVGNVKKRLGDPVGALEAATETVRLAPHDPWAHYNHACYASLVAAWEVGMSGDSESEQIGGYAEDALSSLRTSIAHCEPFRDRASKDADFEWLRTHLLYGRRFADLVGGVAGSHHESP